MTPERAGILAPACAVALAAVGVWGCWRVFVRSARGQVFEEFALRGSRIGAWRLDDQASALLDMVSTPALVLAMLLVVILGAIRGQWVSGVAAAAAVAGANISTQVLKAWVFDRPEFPGDGVAVSGNSLPSGHTTVAASVMFALVLVIPPALRALMAWLGVGVITAFGFATLVNQWHRPSDTVAAVLVVTAWASAAVFVIRLVAWAGGRPMVRSRPGVAFVVLLLLAVIALGIAGFCGYVTWNADLASATRTTQFAAYAGGAALLGAATFAGLGMVLAMLQSAKPDPAQVERSRDTRLTNTSSMLASTGDADTRPNPASRNLEAN